MKEDENYNLYDTNDPRDIREGDTVCIRPIHRPGTAPRPIQVKKISHVYRYVMGVDVYKSYFWLDTSTDKSVNISWEDVGIYTPRISKTAIRKVGMEKGLPDDIIEDMIRNYGGGFKPKKVKR